VIGMGLCQGLDICDQSFPSELGVVDVKHRTPSTRVLENEYKVDMSKFKGLDDIVTDVVDYRSRF